MTTSSDVRRVIARRTGEQDFPWNSPLAALGIDSLLLLRIIADLVSDPDVTIDPATLVDVVTIGDLREFLADLTAQD
jgi:acyl carrier protein